MIVLVLTFDAVCNNFVLSVAQCLFKLTLDFDRSRYPECAARQWSGRNRAGGAAAGFGGGRECERVCHAALRWHALPRGARAPARAAQHTARPVRYTVALAVILVSSQISDPLSPAVLSYAVHLEHLRSHPTHTRTCAVFDGLASLMELN